MLQTQDARVCNSLRENLHKVLFQFQAFICFLIHFLFFFPILTSTDCPLLYPRFSRSFFIFNYTMNLYQRWMSLPAKARYYVAGSTFVFALLGDYVTSRLNEEVVARKKIEEELSQKN